MFFRSVSPVPVSSEPVSVMRQLEVPSSDGIDVVYSDAVEPLPKYDAYSVESLSAAGVPLQAVNPAVLDSVDLVSVDAYISKQSKPATDASKPAASKPAAPKPDAPKPDAPQPVES